MAEYIEKKKLVNSLKMWLMDLENDMNKGDYGELCENKGAREAVESCICEVEEQPAADVQSVYCAENVQTEVLNYLFNKEREAESMSYGGKRQERIVTIREIIRFVEDIDPRMDGEQNENN